MFDLFNDCFYFLQQWWNNLIETPIDDDFDDLDNLDCIVIHSTINDNNNATTFNINDEDKLNPPTKKTISKEQPETEHEWIVLDAFL
jgi:hypothetical protein